MRMIMKLGLEDRVQETPKHLLRYPISDCRDSKRTKFRPSGVFGDVDPPRGYWP